MPKWADYKPLEFDYSNGFNIFLKNFKKALDSALRVNAIIIVQFRNKLKSIRRR